MSDVDFESGKPFKAVISLLGLASVCLAFLSSLFYPILLLHKEFITDKILISFDQLPNDFIIVMTFVLYLLFFWALLGYPAYQLFENYSKYKGVWVLTNTLKDIVKAISFIVYMLLVLSVGHLMSLWIMVNIFNHSSVLDGSLIAPLLTIALTITLTSFIYDYLRIGYQFISKRVKNAF